MIDIQNLNFGFKNKEPLYDDLSLEIKSGSIVGLLGKNGAGKTTLLKIISGLLFPNEGTVRVGKNEPKNRSAAFLSEIYYVAEEFHLPSISIKKHIKANSVFYPGFDHDLMRRLLDEFELIDAHLINSMSYGQKKKYLISFALATKCKLLILDEPTNGLDIPSKAIFRKIIAGSLDEDQLVMISTHQVKDVENLIDTIIMLDQGKVILHKDLLEIATTLQFGQQLTLDEQVLYSENSPSGHDVIKSHGNGSSSVNIELLFNALTSGTNLFENE